MGPYSHIIWDWNGTLLDDVDACVNSVNGMMSRRGLAQIDVSRYREIFCFPVSEYYVELGFDMDSECWDSMAREFHDAYREQSVQLHSGVERLLESFSGLGVSMSVLSACEQEILDCMLDQQHLRRFFLNVCGTDNLYGQSKLVLGRRLMSQLGDKAERVLLVGDTLHDLDVARDLGCACTLVSAGHQSHSRLCNKGVRVVASLDELLT